MSFEVIGRKNSLEVHYHGLFIYVPDDTVAVATDGDGTIYAFKEKPEVLDSEPRAIWYSPNGGAIKIDTVKYDGDWRDSLFELYE